MGIMTHTVVRYTLSTKENMWMDRICTPHTLKMTPRHALEMYTIVSPQDGSEKRQPDVFPSGK